MTGFLILLSALPALSADMPRTLKECVAIGLQRNPNLLRQESRVQQARARVVETRSAEDFRLSTNANYWITTPETSFTLPGAPGVPPQRAVITPNTSYVANLTLSRLLTTFGQLENQVALSSLQADTEQMNFVAARRDLVQAIASGFLQVLKAERLRYLASETVKSWEEHRRQAESLYRNGVVPRYDILRADLEVSRARDQTTAAGKKTDLARASLRSLMGISGEETLRLDERDLEKTVEPDPVLSLDLPGARETALGQRVEMQLMDILVRQGEAALRIAKGSTNPSLALGTTYSRKTTTLLAQDWQWQTALALNWPLFTGREKGARMRQAEEAIRQARLGREDTASKLSLEVENAFLSFREAEERKGTAVIQMDQAREGLRIAQLRYKEGLSPGVELIDARTAFTSAQVNLENSRYDYLESVLNLKKALGYLEEGRFSEKK
ncbi:MAG: TolC family protein [Armatimonadetes bacterium]|nr:TolC family protein [Armatimonadota bacterium]